jgi:hypothetical protein
LARGELFDSLSRYLYTAICDLKLTLPKRIQKMFGSLLKRSIRQTFSYFEHKQFNVIQDDLFIVYLNIYIYDIQEEYFSAK